MTQENKECICELLEPQILNAGEGSYLTSKDWYCPVHGSQHREYETPEGWGGDEVEARMLAKEKPFDESTRVGGSSLTVLPDEVSEWENVLDNKFGTAFQYTKISEEIKSFIKSLLSKEYQRGKRDELEAHRTSEAEAFEAGMRIAYETIVGVIQEELKKLK